MPDDEVVFVGAEKAEIGFQGQVIGDPAELCGNANRVQNINNWLMNSGIEFVRPFDELWPMGDRQAVSPFAVMEDGSTT